MASGRKRPLGSFLRPKIDILFLALNPAPDSAKNKSWFSGNKSFWNLLYRSGLITRPVGEAVGADKLVFGSSSINHKKSVYGAIDLVPDVVESKSRKVKVNDRHLEQLRKTLKSHSVKVLCIMHYRVAEELEKARWIKRRRGYQRRKYGLVGTLGSTRIYEMPFHLGNNVADKHKLYESLLNELKGQR